MQGLSLEQVDLMYRESSSAWYGIAVKSNKARYVLTFLEVLLPLRE